MVIITLYGGLVSQIRAFYIGYKLKRVFGDTLVLDLSQYYNGYYRPYLMDFLNVPDCLRVAVRGTCAVRIASIEDRYQKKLQLIENGEELEKVYNNYDSTQAYYIINDCCNYDIFCQNHPEFFYRYKGDDPATREIMDMMRISTPSEYIDRFDLLIENHESVGIHIRLQDFMRVGWMVEQDYDFYRAAVQWYREQIENALFFVFSDDIILAEEILGTADDIIYMAGTDQCQNDVEQLLCLSKCKHKVLSKKSGFSLFAETISQNKWKLNGYTLLIEQMNLADDAGDKEYVDNRFNKEPICRWEDNISNCILLKRAEIEALNRKYLKKGIVHCDRQEVISSHTEKQAGNLFIFLTLQTYSQTVITGMERMAKWLAAHENEVHFVGERMELPCEPESGNFIWTLENAREAKDFNGNSLGYTLYPYAELNRNDNYMAFTEFLCKDKDIPAYVIVRKRNGLPPLEKHREYHLKFIFVDFSDKYETENWGAMSEDDLEYLYHNADMVITFKSSVYKEYKNILGDKVVLADRRKYFPDEKGWDTKTEELCETNTCEDNLYQYMFELIRSFFNGRG